MKSSVLAIGIAAALTLGIGLTGKAFAETEQQKVNKIHPENRDLRRDKREIQSDRRHIRQDKKKLAHDRLDRDHVKLKENRALEPGHAKAAEQRDKKRQADQGVVNKDKKDLRHDKQDSGQDHTDRNADVHQPNQAARGI